LDAGVEAAVAALVVAAEVVVAEFDVVGVTLA